MPESKRAIIICLGVLILSQSCSVFRGGLSDKKVKTNVLDIAVLETGVIENNLSGRDFIISRVRFEYESDEISRRISGFIKQSKKGEILLSLRSVAGIEVVRAIIRNDSIHIFDRINKTLYIQSIDFLERKYGIRDKDLGFLWGDFPESLSGKIELVKEGNKIVGLLTEKDRKSRFEFDREMGKIKSVSSNSIYSTSFYYSDYRKFDELVYPGRCEIEVNNGEILIKMEFSGLKIEKIKNMKFNPGRNYTTVVLK